MKKIAAALIALTVVAGAATSASAFDAKRFWQDYDLTHSNG